MLFYVFFPKQHQRHALAAQFLVDEAVVGQHIGTRWRRTVDEAVMQLGLVHRLNLLPAQACNMGQPSIFGDNAFGDAQCNGYPFVGEFAHVFETQHVLDIAH